MQGACVSCGQAGVPCERVSETVLRCSAPPRAAGLVSVQLRRCEEGEAGVLGTATFLFMRLEAACEAIFASTNSFGPLPGGVASGHSISAQKDDDVQSASNGSKSGSKSCGRQSPHPAMMSSFRLRSRGSCTLRAAAIAALVLSPLCQCCDWTCEPWLRFDGQRTQVVDATDGAPVEWLLNGSCTVRREINHGCLDQTLTFKGCEQAVSCAEFTRLHALVEIVGLASTGGSIAASTGGSIATVIGNAHQVRDAGRATWQLHGVNETVATGTQVYWFGELLSAVVGRWVEEDSSIKKRIILRPSSPHLLVHTAVNVMAC